MFDVGTNAYTRVGTGRCKTRPRRVGEIVAESAAASPCATMCAARLRFRACDYSPSLARPSLLGEYRAEAKTVRQGQKRFRVMLVGPHPGLPSTPYGVAVGPQAAGNLRPRQARLLLEPLREVVEEDAQVILLWWACCRGMAQNLPAHNGRHSPQASGRGSIPRRGVVRAWKRRNRDQVCIGLGGP